MRQRALSKSTKASLEFRAAHEQYVAASERYEAALVERIDLLEADRAAAVESAFTGMVPTF